MRTMMMAQNSAELYLDDIFSKMTVVTDRNVYNNLIHFKLNDRVVMDYNLTTNQLWCHYEIIWFNLSFKM